MRGTDSLLAEQRPRRRKMRGRVQPYRKGKPRVQGSTLDAMLKGAPFSLPNPQSYFRKGVRRGR